MALAATSMGCIIHKWLLPKLQCPSSCGPPTLASHMLSHMDSQCRVMRLPAVDLTDTGWWPLEIQVYTTAHGRKTDNASSKMLPHPSWDRYLTGKHCVCVMKYLLCFHTPWQFFYSSATDSKDWFGQTGKIWNSLTSLKNTSLNATRSSAPLIQ